MSKSTKSPRTPSIDLGALQATNSAAIGELRKAERALERAQQARDAAKARAEKTAQALKDGFRAIVG